MIYFVQRADGAIKIGTTGHFQQRIALLRQDHGQLELLGLMDGSVSEEKETHERFAHHRITRRGEWFNPGDDLLEFIKRRTHCNVPPPHADQNGVVTLKVDATARAALKYFGAQLLPIKGRLTHSDVIFYLVQCVDPKSAEEAERLGDSPTA